ncbi:MAG: alpha/beta fold hydrolase [Anaeromyxobacter sp.]
MTARAPLILFAPGAGAPSGSAWMSAWAARLAGLGEVVRFDYPYMRSGRRRPDPLPVLVEAHRAALEAARPGRRQVVLVGKSMGGRVGCHLALELEPRPAALVCLGYPLRSPSGKLRDEVLLGLGVPVLFVQGTRDALCPLDLLTAVRKRMQAESALHVVEGGDHSLRVGVRALQAAGRTQEEVDAGVLAEIDDFVKQQGSRSR